MGEVGWRARGKILEQRYHGFFRMQWGLQKYLNEESHDHDISFYMHFSNLFNKILTRKLDEEKISEEKL